jgi:predicted metal-dependent phosphoesterase TrpH
MPMRLDLHIHTTASDGVWSPAAVALRAVGRLDVIALTDHDTVAGIDRARGAVAGLPLHVIPAVELSSTFRGRDIHVLGYFVDPAAPALLDHEARAMGARERRMEEMIGRLREQGIQVDMDAVLHAAGPERGSIGRPHLARVLVEHGHAQDVPDAFDRWIGDVHPAFVPITLLDPAGAVAVVRAAGGIAVWAHPPADLIDTLLPGLVRSGLRGLEVYRPRANSGRAASLERTARTAGLVVTGGSDWHTPEAGLELGNFHVTGEEVALFLEEGGM